MSKVTARSPQTRARSFGGCSTCRSRKIKCDETRPLCGQCSRAGLVCGGYGAKIRFIYNTGYSDGTVAADDIGQDGDGSSRRVLFTETERAAMSREILHQVREDEIDDVVNGLESQTHRLPTVGVLVIGPFALFQANSPLPEASVNDADELASETPAGGMVVSQYAANVQDDLDLALNINMGSASPSFGDPDLFNPFTAFEAVLSEVHVDANRNSNISTYLMPVNRLPTDNSSITPPSPLSLHFHPGGYDSDAPVTPNTHFLLEHYSSQMGKLFSPLRVLKAPWAILHFPRVLTILSELTLFKTTTHAKSSLFYGILSVSAFNFDKVSLEQTGTSNYWWAVGEHFRDRAKKELGQSCDMELCGEERSKYKDILMAILTMVTISVVSGRQEEARSFLLNAEMFICLRGIPKSNKSRKVKLLHHIYLFLRVIEESTYIYPQETRSPLGPSLPRKKMMFPSLRTHSLHAGRDLDECCGGDFELGLLGETGGVGCQQDRTLFEQIYGIPEMLLSFISRTSSLANEIEALKTHSQGPLLPDQLEAQCQSLENEICHWSSKRYGLVDHADDSISSANRAIMPHLVLAIHSAVIIFFYRRVRKLNALLLQPHALKVILHLERAEQKKLGFSVANTGIVWPGFIAAAEATEPDLQQRAYKLLRNCARTSGLRNFDVASDFLQDLWTIRRESADPNISWVDLVRNRKLALVLT